MLNAVRKSVFGGRKDRQSDLSFHDGVPAGLGFKGFSMIEPAPKPKNRMTLKRMTLLKRPTEPPQHLNRNVSEKHRLQGLQDTMKTHTASNDQRFDLFERFNRWYIADGQRHIFYSLFILVQVLCFAFSFCNYALKDNLTQARASFGITFSIARSAAFVLHFDVALILLPICRTLVSRLRRSPLGAVVPFDKNITFHKQIAYSICWWTFVHVAAHMVNFAKLAKNMNTGIMGFLGANFVTGPGITGWIMTFALVLMVWFAIEKRRRANFERFWYSHHLFIVFFAGWQMHGMFCMIRDDTERCSWRQSGVFWQYAVLGIALYSFERVMREIRARQRTYISKVILHPSRVVEIQIKKEKMKSRPGQYIFLCCPEISYWQWHPFTLSSTPQEDFISIHMRIVGNFTTALAEALECDVSKEGEKDLKKAQAAGEVVKLPLNRVLPRVMIDGPFGSASEDYHKFETVMLTGAGVGVTPMASILKSLWYRYNYPSSSTEHMRLRKVYFFWICRDYETFEWFQSLLRAIEEQSTAEFIEIHTYLTAKIKEDDMLNIIHNDVGSELDAVTRLRSPTHYGRPRWTQVFSTIREKHAGQDIGVFYCGPPALGSDLHKNCRAFTEPEQSGTHFIFGKENF